MSDMHVEIRHDQKIVWVRKAGRAIASFAFEEFGGDGKAFDAAMAFVERGADDAPLTPAEAMERCPEVADAIDALRLADGFLKNKGHSEHDPFVRGAILAALAPFIKS